MRHNIVGIFVMGLVLGCGFARAEATNPFAGQTVVGSGGGGAAGGGSSLAAQKTAQSLQNPSAVQYDSSNDTRGREKKAENAQKTGNQGNAAAIATGSALTAAGVPMLASPIISVQVAGAELLAKAALEFAQAGADKKNANKNGAQKDLLLSSQGQNVKQETGGQSKALLTPQLDSLLTDRGVNAQDFVNRLQNGELTSPADILRAVNGGEVNDQALAEGQQIANAQLSSIMSAKPEPLGDEATRKNEYDSKGAEAKSTGTIKSDASDTSANPLAGVSFSPGVGGVGAAVASASSPGSSSSPAAVAAPASAPKAQAIVPLSSDAQASALANAAANSLMALQGSGIALDPGEVNVLQQLGPSVAVGALNNPLVAQVFLEQVGIQKLNPKQNIFQTAHRNFRNFGKWRKETKVAARRLP